MVVSPDARKYIIKLIIVDRFIEPIGHLVILFGNLIQGFHVQHVQDFINTRLDEYPHLVRTDTINIALLEDHFNDLVFVFVNLFGSFANNPLHRFELFLCISFRLQVIAPCATDAVEVLIAYREVKTADNVCELIATVGLEALQEGE